MKENVPHARDGIFKLTAFSGLGGNEDEYPVWMPVEDVARVEAKSDLYTTIIDKRGNKFHVKEKPRLVLRGLGWLDESKMQ